MGENKEELQITVKLGDKIHELNLNADLEIDKTIMNKELAKQPALFAWYATLYEIAKDKTAHLKHKIETFEASLELEIRQMASPPVKLTVDSIKAIIRDDKVHRRMAEELLHAKKSEGMLQVAKASFDQRKDMLISLSSNMRAEMDDDIKILKQTAHKTMAKN